MCPCVHAVDPTNQSDLDVAPASETISSTHRRSPAKQLMRCAQRQDRSQLVPSQPHPQIPNVSHRSCYRHTNTHVLSMHDCVARRRMCHEPGQHAPSTTETYAPGNEGTETTRSVAVPVCADPTTTHHTAAAAGMLKLTHCPWPVEGCAMNRVSMRHRRPKHTGKTHYKQFKVSGRHGTISAQPHHVTMQMLHPGIITHPLFMARRRMCHEPGYHAPPTAET